MARWWTLCLGVLLLLQLTTYSAGIGCYTCDPCGDKILMELNKDCTVCEFSTTLSDPKNKANQKRRCVPEFKSDCEVQGDRKVCQCTTNNCNEGITGPTTCTCGVAPEKKPEKKPGGGGSSAGSHGLSCFAIVASFLVGVYQWNSLKALDD